MTVIPLRVSFTITCSIIDGCEVLSAMTLGDDEKWAWGGSQNEWRRRSRQG